VGGELPGRPDRAVEDSGILARRTAPAPSREPVGGMATVWPRAVGQTADPSGAEASGWSTRSVVIRWSSSQSAPVFAEVPESDRRGKTVRAAVHARISSDRAGSGLGVAIQVTECGALADARG